jgi:hypothetical protein
MTGIPAKKEIRRVEHLIAAGDAGNMLRDELRDELKRRGLDSTGKPWELKERMQEEFDSGRKTPAKKNEGVGIQAKYAKALQALKSKSIEREAHGAKAQGQGSDLFNSGNAGGQENSAPVEKWNLNRGAGVMLDYMRTRGIMGGLILPSKEDMVAKDKQTLDGEVASFLKNSKSAFDITISSEEAAQFPSGDPITAACSTLGVTAQQVLLVTSNPKYLAAARDAECFSAHLTVKNARRPNIRPTHTIYGLLDVQTAVEEYNGITWRA